MNDEALMTNDERVTKSETRKARVEDSFWDDGAGVIREEPETKRVYDLEERTARFGEAIIDFAKTIPQNPVTNRIITQLFGAATSVGANYVEADNARLEEGFSQKHRNVSKGSMRNKIFSSDDSSCCPGVEVASTSNLGGSCRTPSNLLKNLERSET